MDIQRIVARGYDRALIQKAATSPLTTKEARAFLRAVETDEPEEIAPGRLRQRCRACRNCFGWVIILGRFCSPECAGIDPGDYHRAVRLVVEADGKYCPRCRGHHGKAKRIYTDRERDLAESDARGLTASTGRAYEVYLCPLGYRHVGSKR